MKNLTLTNVLKITTFLLIIFLSTIVLVDAFSNGANI